MKRILIVLIPIILIIANLQFFFYNEIKSYPELNDFFTSDKQLTSYSEQETTHLFEVKNLLNNSLMIIMIFLILLIYLTIKLSKQDLVKFSLHGFILTLAIILSLFIFKFNTIFIIFHKILFQNNNWLLPANSLLIQQFPIQYFYNISRKIAIFIILESLAGILILLGIKKQITNLKFKRRS